MDEIRAEALRHLGDEPGDFVRVTWSVTVTRGDEGISVDSSREIRKSDMVAPNSWLSLTLGVAFDPG
jgi:hypothetical protein